MKVYFRKAKMTNTDFVEILQQNHIVDENIDKTYDVIFNMSAFDYKIAEDLSKKYPHIPVVNYVWDFYKWAFEGRRTGSFTDWKGYGEFLKKSDLVIVPSKAQGLRLKELLGIDSVVVYAGHKMFESDSVRDDGFVLDHMRWYPEENEKWVVTICNTNYIPVVHPEHRMERDQIELMIATCRFLACGYREASTGGLTILEGLWHGKPVLLSDSVYQGGIEYAGQFGTYFHYNDYQDCKKKIQEMYNHPPKIDIKEARKFIKENFTYEVMAKNLEAEFKKICQKKKSSYS